MEVDRMNASQGSRVAVGLNQGSRFKDYLRGFLDPYEKDLKLRGLTRSSQLDILGCLRRYLIWAAERGIDPRNAKRDDLPAYL
jgi:hypothetical protein